jgi:hypothetical protein
MGCTGRGICTKTKNISGCGEPVTVIFAVDTSNGKKVSITFNIAQDTTLEPGQSPFWRQGAQPYSFDVPFSLSRDNPIFANDTTWPFVPGDIIPANVPFTQTMDTGGNVTITIRSEVTRPVHAWVIFGGTGPNGFDPAMKGIYQCATDSMPPVGDAFAIPVTFSIASDDASYLLLSFSRDYLQRQPAQDTNFTPGKIGYRFATNFDLAGQMFAPLKLPESAQVLTTSASWLNTGPQSNMIVDSLLYSINLLSTACGADTDLKLTPESSAVSATWVDFSGSVGTDWSIELQGGVINNKGFVRAGVQHVTITGLPPATTYTFSIRPVCSGGEHGVMISKTFTTK